MTISEKIVEGMAAKSISAWQRMTHWVFGGSIASGVSGKVLAASEPLQAPAIFGVDISTITLCAGAIGAIFAAMSYALTFYAKFRLTRDGRFGDIVK